MQTHATRIKSIFFTIIGLTLSGQVLAQTAVQPKINSGDTWDYKETVEKGPHGWQQNVEEMSVTHATASSIYYTVKQADSTQGGIDKIAGIDWSRVRDVNGKETVVNQPLSFPLSSGKTWQIQYTEQHPNKQHRSEQWQDKYTVVGYETIEVPAGKFNAIKIEAEGTWTAEMEPTQTIVQGVQTQQSNTSMMTNVQRTAATTASGRTYKAFWYVPEVKRFVKSLEEFYGSGGVRTARYTDELSSFKVTD